MFDETPARVKPVVLIDPGHGGIDPGAIGPGRTAEKTVVLAVAKALAAALEEGGRYDVRLTRTTDVFIPLQNRVQISVDAQADVFISLHVDATDERILSTRGASIYTLSDKASDEQARLMAEKENAADLAAGVEQQPGEQGEEIKGILFDLMARETAVFSHVLSRSLAGALSRAGGLARDPERAAAFVVLKQTHVPSVLVELGFLSNPAEERQMMQPVWQQQMATSIASAVDTYFERRHTTAAQGSAGLATGGLPP